ncbi:hypothetical protein C5167_008608 [Papaver somniferum]|uniref:Uncharacterized protein n=1 Tax=Papaver somniferum TaxID=3469 RepID=A0A4Y7JYZ9_PAPSO|nr:hypothetical protein C5167_008608 [Papaver somniferum]
MVEEAVEVHYNQQGLLLLEGIKFNRVMQFGWHHLYHSGAATDHGGTSLTLICFTAFFDKRKLHHELRQGKEDK